MSADLISGLWRGEAAALALGAWSGRQWEDLLGQARRGQLLARLALRLDDARPGGLAALAAPQRDALLGALRLVERQGHEVNAELAHLRLALQALPGPVVLLKGAAYLCAGLPPSRGRLFSDIDILVPRAQLQAAEGALFAAGWISQERDPYNQRYYREWMHEVPPLLHITRGSAVDLHHTIAPPTSRFRVDAGLLLQEIRPAGDAEGFFHILSPRDMVLHSAAHLYQEGEFDHGLRDVLDLADLLAHFGATEPGFWPGLIARAAELGLGEPLSLLLVQVQRVSGVAPPPACAAGLAALRPARLRAAWLTSLLTRALRPPHPSCDARAHARARSLLYLRSHMIRMPLRLIVPHLLRKAWMAQFPERPAAG